MAPVYHSRMSALRRLIAASFRRGDLVRCGTVSAREYYGSSSEQKQTGAVCSCPLCGLKVPGGKGLLDRHIRATHTPLIMSRLAADPEATYSAIFGRPPKRINANELRYGEGLAVTRKGSYRGFWYDFSESRGGGPIEAILKAAADMTYGEAAVKAAALAGIDYQGSDTEAREKQLVEDLAEHTERQLQAENRLKNLRIETARNIWRAGVPLQGTLGETYLVKHRGIPAEVLSRLSLQFLEPGVPYTEYDLMGMKQKRFNNDPALLVPVEDPKGELTGIQRIYVDPKTGAKPSWQGKPTKHKFSLGSLAGNGGVVQRGAVGGDVIVAEGPETCASLAAVAPPETWVVAALSVGNFANLAKYVISKKPKSRVIFAGDNDDNKDSPDRNGSKVGEMFYRNCTAASAEIRSSWRPVKVILARPEKAGADWNDVLVTQGLGELTKQFWDKVNHS